MYGHLEDDDFTRLHIYEYFLDLKCMYVYLNNFKYGYVKPYGLYHIHIQDSFNWNDLHQKLYHEEDCNEAQASTCQFRVGGVFIDSL